MTSERQELIDQIDQIDSLINWIVLVRSENASEDVMDLLELKMFITMQIESLTSDSESDDELETSSSDDQIEFGS
jgi:hypothetical protein